MRLMAEVVYEMSAGEITQLASTGVLEQDEAEYLTGSKRHRFSSLPVVSGWPGGRRFPEEAQVLQASGTGSGWVSNRGRRFGFHGLTPAVG